MAENEVGGSNLKTSARWMVRVLVGVMFMLIWAASAWIVQSDRQQTIERTYAVNEQIARNFSEHATRSFMAADRLTQHIRQQYARSGSRFDLVKYFADNPLDKELFRSAAITDENGLSFASSIPYFVPANIADRDVFKVHMNSKSDELYISQPLVTKVGQRHSIIASRRISKPDGSFGGTVGVAMDPAYFVHFYAQHKLGERSIITLMGMDGIPRVRLMGGEQVAEGSGMSAEFLQPLTIAPAGNDDRVSPIDQVRRFSSYRKLSAYPFVVIVGIEHAFALQPHVWRRNLVLLGATALSFMLLIVIWVSTRAGLRLRQAYSRLVASRQALALSNRSLEERVTQQTAAIRDREAAMRLLTEGVPVVLAYFDTNLILRMGNHRAGVVFGEGDLRSVIGKPLSEIISPEQQALSAREVELALGGAAQRFEMPLAGDRTKWSEVMLLPNRNEAGEVIGVFATMTDISARKHLDIQLKRLLARQQAVFEASTDALAVFDEDGEPVAFNQRYPALWAIPEDVLQRKDLIEIRDHNLRQVKGPETYLALLEATRRKDFVPGADFLFETLDGRFIERAVQPYVDEEGFAGRVVRFRDVTQTRKAQAALREADLRYRAIIASMSQGVVVRNREGLIIDCNASAEHIIGKKLAQLQGCRSVYETEGWLAIHEDGSPMRFEERSATRSIEEYKAVANVVIGWCRPDGSVQWWLASSCPLFKDDDAVPDGIFTVFIDITTRKDAERERAVLDGQLKRTLARLTAVFEASKDGLVILDRAEGMAMFNRRYADIWAISAEMERRNDFLEIRAHILKQLKNPAAYVEQIGTVDRHESSGDAEFLLETLDGRFIERLPRTYIDGGVVVGTVVRMRDITESRNAMAALRAADLRYRSIVSSMTQGVVIRNRQGLIIDCNPSAEQITGKKLAQLQGSKTIYEAEGWRLIHEDGSPMRPEETSALRALASRTPIVNVVTGWCRPDGSVQWLLSSSSPLLKESETEPDGVFTVFADITARKENERERALLEAQLRESQKMEAMGTLAGGIAHDFNNMLAAILGNVALAKMDLENTHPALVSVEEIQRAAERAKHLVHQILAFGSKQGHEMATISLQPAIEESLRLLRATLPAGVRIETRFDAATPPVTADANQIGQVLVNLCNNAWHAMQTGEKSRVLGEHARGNSISVALDGIEIGEANALRFGAVAPGRHARITVSDNGIGMDAETAKRIFEPFFSTRPLGEGTGLGLAVVYGIVAGHRGAIAVTTSPGQGATFEIVLPVAEGAAADVPVAIPTSAPPGALGGAEETEGRGRHVLYVDDEPSLVFLVTRLLKKRGFRVTSYDRGELAVQALRANPFGYDAVVTDYNMPGMSGLDVAREVRSANSSLPVAIISGYVSDELRAQTEKTGLAKLLYKENTVEQLCTSIVDLMETMASEKHQPPA